MIFTFGQPVLLRNPEMKSLAKLFPRWTTGAWLGKSIDADEHIVATALGIRQGRACRAMAVSEANPDLWQNVRSATWGESGAAPPVGDGQEAARGE
eukprot:5514832-Heterocapsa_arctica.AAC.1